MARTLLSFILTCFMIGCLAQGSRTRLEFRVLLLPDSSFAAFANVYLKNNRGIGTIANEQGEFSFSYADSLSSDTLTISYLGHKPYYFPLSERASPLVIYLDPEIVTLKEIVVTANGDLAGSIIQKSVDNVRRNYPTRIHFLEAFYRQLDTKDSAYVYLLEAALTIQDYTYRKPPRRARIKVEQLRKSDDQGENSAIAVRAGKWLAEKFDVAVNEFYRVFDLRYLRRDYLLGDWDFSIGEYFVEEGDTVVQIFFDTPAKYRGNIRKNGIIHVNLSDYAIISFEQFGIVNGVVNPQSLIRFQKVGDKYYPKFISQSKPRFTSFGVWQYSNASLVITNIIENNNRAYKIKKAFASRRDDLIQERDYPYNQLFWENYNILKLTPLSVRAKRDLERLKSIEDQFKQNAKDH